MSLISSYIEKKLGLNEPEPTHTPLNAFPLMQLSYKSFMYKEAIKIPSVKKAFHVIAGTIATFPIQVYKDGVKLDNDDPFTKLVTRPNNTMGITQMLMNTLREGIWYGRALWRVKDRNLDLYPIEWEFISQSRCAYTEENNEITLISIDGKNVHKDDVIIFEYPVIGNISESTDLLDLYKDLQDAAKNYAESPHPKGILKYLGQSKITPKEVAQYIKNWNGWRKTSSVAWLTRDMEYQTVGYSARDLQLTEAREHAATETARIFGITAASIDAKTSDSMTYSNVLESRRDLLECLMPWILLTQEVLTKHLPPYCQARFEIDTYTRDSPLTRMNTWNTAIQAGILTVDEVRQLEPLTNDLKK